MRLAEEILFRLSRWRLRRGSASAGRIELTKDATKYAQWRDKELRQQLEEGFPCGALSGKQVLDFGCGEGTLAFYLSSQFGTAGVVGLDIAPTAIDSAQKRLEREGAQSISFRLAREPTKVDCGNASIDILCAFDTVEHIVYPKEILREWHRVLKPGGQVWIWWLPWRHPYGHHVTSLIPLPWVHLICSEKTLIAVAARIYDDPCYTPRVWDLDPATGVKRPNKWRQGADLSSWLNKLTLREFKRMAGEAGFQCAISAHGIGESGRLRPIAWVARLPFLGEFFTSHYTAILTGKAD